MSSQTKNIKFKHNQPFQMTFTKAWKLLETQTSKKEFEVAVKLSLMAKAFTNSLEPLSQDSTTRELAEQFKCCATDISKVFKRLFELGVIGKFETGNKFNRIERYYVFNPYLSFNGNEIDELIPNLFSETIYANIK